MPSFLASPTTPATHASSSAGSSVRATIIAYARSILPSSLPASFYDFVPFILAGFMALLFTALLVLLVEDSEDVYPHSPRLNRTSNSQSSKAHKKRLVGLAEQDSDAERGDDEWDYNAAWDPRADMDSSRASNLKLSQDWARVQNEKMADSGYRYRTTSRRLLASPPPSASPQSPAFTPPILSMAKLIMHRHDQSSKRARAASSRPSPPPSPPAVGSGMGSFGPMQYTLKSAREIKIAFPTEDDGSPPPSPPPPSPSSSTMASPPPSPTSISMPSSPTRHTRSRVLSDSFSSLPSLIPSLQMLQKQAPVTNEHAIRRRPSGMLEEGGVPAESSEPSLRERSPSEEEKTPSESSRKKRRSRKRSGSGAKSRAAATLIALEEGSR